MTPDDRERRDTTDIAGGAGAENGQDDENDNSFGGEDDDYYSDENRSHSSEEVEYTGAAAMTLAEELMELQNANNMAEMGASDAGHEDDDAGLAFEVDNVDEGTNSAMLSNNM